MKIKILKPSEANMWYNKYVGEIFEIDESKTTETTYTIKEKAVRWVREVYKEDCLLLEYNECPECLQPTPEDELDMFGGLCEECCSWD